MLVRLADGRTTFIDFRERAPKAASRTMYVDARRDSVEGWRAAGVPGTVRGLELAHQKYGSKPWKSLVDPAVRLAKRGYEISYRQSESLRSATVLEKFPESKRIFLKGGTHYEAGDKFKQPELARTLARIAKKGARDFYEGETARILADHMHRNGGLITLDDLKDYRAIEREPLKGNYNGFEIIASPPPSSGGIGLLQMTGMLQGSGYERAGIGSAAAIHYVAEAMRRYFTDRSQFIADPDFFRVPLPQLIAPARIAAMRATINPARATPSADMKPSIEAGGDTTHFSIVDAKGNAVSLTYTINDGYGSGVTVPVLGFLLNDEMDDFTSVPGSPNLFGLIQGEANAIVPGKRPLSSMTPTIVLRDGKLFLVLGAPGGPRIINAVLQVMLNVIDFKMNIQDAIDAPRFHHQWLPDQISMEKGFSPDTVAILQNMGHKIAPIANVASVEAILVSGKWLEGGSDGRAGGKASGY
jgi:gamma-glutamyltranspeptidase/glutathione hydrolase